MTEPSPTARADYFAVKPDLVGQLRSITRAMEQFTVARGLRALVETRISQLNGCVYCTDLHSREARAAGERQPRLDHLPVWRESPLFTPREKAALAWAECVTRADFGAAGDAAYARLRKHFSETELVELSLSASLTNFWNRMAAGFRKQPAPVAGEDRHP